MYIIQYYSIVSLVSARWRREGSAAARTAGARSSPRRTRTSPSTAPSPWRVGPSGRSANQPAFSSWERIFLPNAFFRDDASTEFFSKEWNTSLRLFILSFYNCFDAITETVITEIALAQRHRIIFRMTLRSVSLTSTSVFFSISFLALPSFFPLPPRGSTKKGDFTSVSQSLSPSSNLKMAEETPTFAEDFEFDSEVFCSRGLHFELLSR